MGVVVEGSVGPVLIVVVHECLVGLGAFGVGVLKGNTFGLFSRVRRFVDCSFTCFATFSYAI